MVKKKMFGCFEAFVALCLCALLLFSADGLWLQRAVSDQVIRLHIEANSDGAQDQAVKLLVRDAVLARAQRVCAQAKTRGEAETLLRENLGALEETAERTLQSAGFAYGAQAVLAREHDPMRQYDDFALPAGEYLALRIKLGQAQGQNWWCVVFPALCGSSAPDTAAADAGLTPRQLRFLHGDGQAQVRFRLCELWEKIRAHFR